MFTGIIEKTARIKDKRRDRNGIYFAIECPFDEVLKEGSSIAVNGVCLTVVETAETMFMVFAGEETLKRTNLGRLKKNDFVNLERPLKFGDRIDGHFLLGHIDTTGTIRSIVKNNASALMSVSYPEDYSAFVVDKGSIGLDGISLTVVEPSKNLFKVFLVPYTLNATTMRTKSVGDIVNIEFDILIKSMKGTIGYAQKRRNILY